METAPSPAFASLLRRYRQAAGLTQEELAERAGLGVRTIGDLERGVSQAPRKDTVDLLAGALVLAPPQRAALAEAARRLSTAACALPGPAVPSLVGRSHELALLERHLAGEGPPLLLLAGAPGIGKTRLLHAALPRAVAQGLRVLDGGCQRQGGHEPYAPLLGALQRHLRHQSPAQLRTELAGCAWLVRLLPELEAGPIEPLPAWTLPPEQERRLMAQAVVRLLANVAGPAGTLLLLDDLQWAGPDALALLATLLRSAQTPLRVLGAYRATEVRPGEPLAGTLADLAHAGLAAHHSLGPLSPEEAGQLLAALLADAADVEPALQQRALQRAGGVPFFVVSCARALRAGAGATLPWDLAQSIRQRVAALPAGAQEVLGVAAVVGRVVPRRVLAAAAACGEGELLAALEAACRAQLLEEAGAETYLFLHDVIREVVEADVGAARRAALHRRVAEALEAQPGAPPTELLAYHYSRSGVLEKAALYLERAGDDARAQYAHAAAEGCYRDAVERLDGLGRTGDAARVREKLGGVLRTQRRYDVALEALETAATTYRAAGELESLGRTVAQIGQVHAARGASEQGLSLLQPVLERLEASGPSPALAALYAALAHLFFAGDRPQEGLAAAERAAALARALDDDRVLADAETRRGLALLALGRFEEARRALEEAIRRAEAAHDLPGLVRALTNVAPACAAMGEYDTGRAYAERALAVAERWGDAVQVLYARLGLGAMYFFLGDWIRARAELERAVATCRALEVPGVLAANLRAGTLVELGRLCLAEGAWDAAARYLQEGLALAQRSIPWGLPAQAQSLLAERDILEGRPEAARARLAPLLDRSSQFWAKDLAPVAAWAQLELGDVAAAEETIATAIVRARATTFRVALVDALRVQAMVCARQGRWAEAEQALEEGLSLARGMPHPYAEGRLLHVYGVMHAQKGEPEPARERLHAALAIFRRLGARKDAERTEQVLAADVQR